MVGQHKRNVFPMLSSPRCGAKTRSGKSCRSPAVSSKKRCRMHGGAKGSGAPQGNMNALKRGFYTREIKDYQRYVMEHIKASKNTMKEF